VSTEGLVVPDVDGLYTGRERREMKRCWRRRKPLLPRMMIRRARTRRGRASARP
jgi:hypothetical protein